MVSIATPVVTNTNAPAPLREIKVEVRHTLARTPKGRPICTYTVLKFLRFDEVTGYPIIRRTEIKHRTFESFKKKHYQAGNKYLHRLHGYWCFKF